MAGMTAGHRTGSQKTTASRVVPDAKGDPPRRQRTLPLPELVEGEVRGGMHAHGGVG